MINWLKSLLRKKASDALGIDKRTEQDNIYVGYIPYKGPKAIVQEGSMLHVWQTKGWNGFTQTMWVTPLGKNENPKENGLCIIDASKVQACSHFTDKEIVDWLRHVITDVSSVDKFEERYIRIIEDKWIPPRLREFAFKELKSHYSDNKYDLRNGRLFRNEKLWDEIEVH